MPHIHSLGTDFVTEVYIVCGNRVLLRMHDKYKIWLPPGGHIAQVGMREDPNQAALRKVLEEVGISDLVLYNPLPLAWVNPPEAMEEVLPLVPPVHLNIHNVGSEGHAHVALIFFAKSVRGEVRGATAAHEQSSALKWCTKEDLEQMELPSSTLRYALHALAILGT